MPNVGFGGVAVERSSSWHRQANGGLLISMCIHVDGGMVRLYDVRRCLGEVESSGKTVGG